jgi:aspartyl-tRNA(Asn)/glutamyl-tRNA(Gln) amidotransferase subunit A
VPASLAGLPAVSLPLNKQPLPLGLELIAPSFAEAKLLNVAAACEKLINLKNIKPLL